jgi:hypothetical protein
VPAVARTSLSLATQGDQSTDLARARKPIIFDTSSSEDRTLWTTVLSSASRAITPHMRAETTVSGQWLGAKAIIRTSAGSCPMETRRERYHIELFEQPHNNRLQRPALRAAAEPTR